MRQKSLIVYILFLCAAFGASLIPEFIEMGFLTDKMMHVLIVCLALIWPCLNFERWRNIFILSALFLCAGAGIEILQTLTPDRHMEIEDILANITGILFGLVIGYLLRTGYYAENPDLINRRNERSP